MKKNDEILDVTSALVPPLLSALDALQMASRFMHPPNIAAVVEVISDKQLAVRDGLHTFQSAEWPENLERFFVAVKESAENALEAFAFFDEAVKQSEPAMTAYRAMGLVTKALESMYPVASMLAPVSRFYLEDSSRSNDLLLKRLEDADTSKSDVGVMHANNSDRERGGFSMYVPEYYQGEETPLVVALHGGSGHGRNFLWSWLVAARSKNAIVVAPTSLGGTWSLMDPQSDIQHLESLVSYVRKNWSIDSKKILLTGMSDGGTFTYVAGLEKNSAFTHLAPCSASFHPMLLEAADPERLKGLPIYLMHGALDWMFSAQVARSAKDSFSTAGSSIEYHEVEDLSHVYPREFSAKILDWMTGNRL